MSLYTNQSMSVLYFLVVKSPQIEMNRKKFLFQMIINITILLDISGVFLSSLSCHCDSFIDIRDKSIIV